MRALPFRYPKLNRRTSCWILSLATPLLAGVTAYSGVFAHAVRNFQGLTSKDPFWREAEFLLLGAGPLVLGAFFLVALWWHRRGITLAALTAASLCLLAMFIWPTPLPDMAPLLIYLMGVLAYFATLTRTESPKA